MADDASGERGGERLRLTVKTTKDKIEVEVPADYTVKELKEHLADKRDGLAVPQLCLIFAGHILKDEETLESQGVKTDVTIHLVVRSTPGQTRPQQSSTATRSTQPQSSSVGMGPTGGLGMGPAGGLGMGASGGGDLQAQMMQAQQQLMSNPELMQQLMESPLMQNLLANPDNLQSMLTSNPQIQQLMERNPELTHVLHNPELMRQAMEMARNPAAMREMMRSQDRQLSNIESIPGGFNALARMYHEIQEPMMDAAQESIQQQMQNNPFSALFNQQQGTPNPGPSAPQGTSNTAPLPNPWAGATSSTPRTTGASSTRTTTSTSGSGSGSTVPPGPGGLGGNVQQQMMQQFLSNPELMSQAMQMQSQMQAGGMGGGGGGGGVSMPDPQTMAQMMQNPVYQQMMQQVLSNPQLMEQMMRNHPLFANNPQATEMARQSAQMMQGEEFQRLMSNPAALSAMMQIQQGMMRLQATSPAILSQTMPGPPPPSSQQSGGQGGGITQEMLQQMLSQITPPTSQSGTQPSPPSISSGGVPPLPLIQQQQQAEVLYRTQLEQLANMGFHDRQRNLTVLIETGGDLNAAVNRLIG